MRAAVLGLILLLAAAPAPALADQVRVKDVLTSVGLVK